MPKIHPTAIVDPGAELADDVEVGPYCIIEADVKIGPGCTLRSHVIVRRYTTLGEANYVDSFTALGGDPQDLKFDPSSVSYVRIGDGNTFREGVTISRATGEGKCTVIGDRIYFMAYSHAGHNAIVEDGVILANGASVGGFGRIGRGTIMSAHVSVHQFTRMGQLCMSQGNSGTSMHVPPYCILAGINRIAGLNTVGLRRAEDMTDEDRSQIKEAFRITFRAGLGLTEAIEKMDACDDWGVAAGKFRDFVRWIAQADVPYNRGLCPRRPYRR